MNSILIVLPILTVLMFDLGLTLEGKDFLLVLKRFKAFTAGLAGQIIILPLIAWGIASLLNLSPMMSIGLVLIACCPGGSSSNVFSKLAKGDVALSVSLTAISRIVTLFTLPPVMQAVNAHTGAAAGIHLPVRNLLMQNIVTMLLPILLGILAASGDLPPLPEDAAFLGELSLSGTLRGVTGVLPMALAARAAGLRTPYVPAETAAALEVPAAALDWRGVDLCARWYLSLRHI